MKQQPKIITVMLSLFRLTAIGAGKVFRIPENHTRSLLAIFPEEVS